MKHQCFQQPNICFLLTRDFTVNTLSKISIALTAIGLLTSYAHAQLRSRLKPTGVEVSFQHDGEDRDYRIHVPDGYDSKEKTPLFIFLHGGGGNSAQSSGMGLTPVADRHGFIAVYPNAIDKHWNDGRDSKVHADHDQKINDAAFIIAVLDRVSDEYNIDSNRVFVSGVSNGGFMSQRMAMEHSTRFSAAGIVIASMGKAIEKQFAPELPVSILYMNGTEDPLVPYTGGPLTLDLFPKLRKLRNRPLQSRGICIPTEDAVSMWVKKNKLTKPPTVEQLPDKSTDDDSKVELSLWENGDRGTAVALYKVVGGGHTLPGLPHRLPEKWVGKTNMDIHGFEVIWEFFDKHGRQHSSDATAADHSN